MITDTKNYFKINRINNGNCKNLGVKCTYKPKKTFKICKNNPHEKFKQVEQTALTF